MIALILVQRRKEMEKIYSEMYATLVGRVDNAITELEEEEKKEQFDRNRIQNIIKMLKDALLEAEETFVKGNE